MDDLSHLLTKLHLTWQQFGGGDVCLTHEPNSHPHNATILAAITYDGVTYGWLQAYPPPDKREVAQLLLQSWADLLGAIGKEHQVVESLTERLIRAWNRLSFIHQVNELMRTTTDPSRISLEVLRFAVQAVEAEKAFIAQLVDDTLVFRWAYPAYDEIEMRRIITVLQTVDRVLVCSEAVCQTMFPDLTDLHSFMGQQLNATSGPPLFICLTNQISRRDFNDGDIQLFKSLVEQIAALIDVEALHLQRIKAKELHRDLEIAAEVQVSFLPSELPQVPGYEFAAKLISALKIGGDFYDMYQINGQTGLLVCDVVGKGIPAALLAAHTQAALHTAFQYSHSPDQVLEYANTSLYQKMQRNDGFATVAILCLSHHDAVHHYASAGHTAALWVHADPLQIQKLPSTTLPLGIFPHIEAHTLPLELHPNDVLLIYSDGLTEAENEQGKILGISGVIDILLATHLAPAQFILDSLIETSVYHRSRAPVMDDLTVLVIKKINAHSPLAHYLERLRLPSDLSVLVELETKLDKLKPYLPSTERTVIWLMEMQLALTEVVSNIIKHAYAGDCGHSIHGLIALYPEWLQIDLFDKGNGYEPRELPVLILDPCNLPEGGYGLYIIHRIMDVVTYNRLANGYNHWRLIRKLPA